ncbi:MAG: transcriptional coactivator PipX [Elainellaceae cyanobacterium]
MSSETYLNHPTFGLLYQVCLIENQKELFATLYAQRLFFIVTSGAGGVEFDPIGRTDARALVESRLRVLRHTSSRHEYEALQFVHKQTF